MLSSIEFAEKLFATQDREQIWQHCQSYFAQYGFDGLIYLDAKRDGMKFLSSLPDYWINHYIDRDYQKIDPFLAFCCRSNGLTLTGRAFLNRYNYLSTAQRNLIKEAGETGYAAGFASPFRLMGPGGAGGWNFLSEMSASEVEQTVGEHGHSLQMAGMFAHTALSTASDNVAETLSPREKEALCWLASGLRGQQIAHKMGLSPVTVEFHIKNARKKLGAATREQALAIAISKGLISV